MKTQVINVECLTDASRIFFNGRLWRPISISAAGILFGDCQNQNAMVWFDRGNKVCLVLPEKTENIIAETIARIENVMEKIGSAPQRRVVNFQDWADRQRRIAKWRQQITEFSSEQLEASQKLIDHQIQSSLQWAEINQREQAAEQLRQKAQKQIQNISQIENRWAKQEQEAFRHKQEVNQRLQDLIQREQKVNQ